MKSIYLRTVLYVHVPDKYDLVELAHQTMSGDH